MAGAFFLRNAENSVILRFRLIDINNSLNNNVTLGKQTMKKQVIIILSLLMATLMIASCGDKEEESSTPSAPAVDTSFIIGKWKHSNMKMGGVFDFKKDGTVVKDEMNDASGTWKISDDGKKLTITFGSSQFRMTHTDEIIGFTDKVITMKKENGQSFTYTRME